MEPTSASGSKGLFESPFPAGALLFISVSMFWIYCLPPGLAPYRDAGEMSCVVKTLGIAHQPGYPLYILSAKLSSLILPGNFAYKLNLFSALGGLAALLTLYFLLAARFGIFPGLAAVMLFSLNFTMQTVSSVSEMYALNILLAAVLLSIALSFERSWSLRRLFLGSYLLCLAMTNRMDIVLTAPALLIAVWPGIKFSTFSAAVKAVFGSALFWSAGFSLYLYLMTRSGGNPLFDWSHPADFATFLAVITRKSYGSTLDLISRNYSAGEMFWPNMKQYGLHLVRNFNFALVFAAAGLFREFAQNRRRFFVIFALFAVPGPVFLFMANMPPNPHALAIVEPYYLLPDLAVVFWAAAGLAFIVKAEGLRLKTDVRLWAVLAAVTVFITMAALENLPHANRRMLFAAEDWGADVMKSVPDSACLVGKKDVQIFTLWYLQSVRGLRPDLKIVSQGLSGARWYQNSKGLWQPDLKLFNLNTGGAAEWANFNRYNPAGVYATLDSELPSSASAGPRGLVNVLYYKGYAYDMWPFYNFRWFAGEYNDFFTKDLGASYAAGILARAAWLNNNGGLNAEDARRLELARIMDPDLPDAALYLGFYYSTSKDWPKAGECFRRSAMVYERLLGLAGEYYALPELKDGLAKSAAYAWLNYGVALEKTGDPQAAENAYRKALESNPEMAEAHYNMAILYWTRDPNRVYEELSAALRIDPNHRQARYYLSRILPINAGKR
jgi:tetratricopeptide (TPR) repeat protein